jgi:hypothetical protein
MFIADDHGAPGRAFLNFFQVEKFSGGRKGILRVRLASEEAGS